MITYRMNCPIHRGNTMETSKLIERKGATKKEPLFECKECGRYYLYDLNKSGIKIGTYGERAVVGTDMKYTLHSDAFAQGSIWKDNNPAKISQKTKTTSGNADSQFVDTTVRIKKVKNAEVSKAKNNLANIRNEFPTVATEKMSVQDFMLKVCGSFTDHDCVVRNTSLTWKGSHVRKVEFYVRDSQYLKMKLSEGIYISFAGKISNGEFIIDEIRVLENPSVTNGWMVQKLKFAYDGPNHSNWFYTITETDAEPSKELTGELKSWNDYLTWKRQLAELRIKGIKYIEVKFDIEERRVIFLSVTDGAESAKEFRKFLNRNEVSAFSNKYSKDRWYFEFNREYQDAQDTGIDLAFVEYGEIYKSTDSLRRSEWSNLQTPHRKYKDEKEGLSFQDRLAGIANNYFSPYFQELVFEMSDRAMMLIRRDIRRFGSVSDATENTIAEEFYADGYLATTQIGDFALLSRLQRAIDDLSNGKAAQQTLDKWLFNVKKAGKPDSIDEITIWQNKKINDKQKQAVQKIISAPNVCLIQGPPGTGKTTVIAEAIYQLVIRNKRVLVASQANLAVDNALERLIANPKIRAIRLGNARKIDDSVKNITEEHVLETFYNSVVDYIQTDYLDKWEESDDIELKARREIEHYRDCCDKLVELDAIIQKKNLEIHELASCISSDEYQLHQNAMLSEKMSLIMLVTYCEANSDSLELMLGKECISGLWGCIQEFVKELANKGIYLTKVGIDDLSSAIKLMQANRVVKYIITNARNTLALSAKIDNDTQFGGESEEIENLKLHEIELRNQMMSDPSVIVEWQSVTRQIKELSQNGITLTDEELSIFDGIYEVPDNERRLYLKTIIDTNKECLKNLIECIVSYARKMTKEIEVRIVAEEQNVTEYEKQIDAKKKELQSVSEERNNLCSIIDSILKKYNATDANLEENVQTNIDKRKNALATNLDRDDWEEVFAGLRDWVNDIPDYSQEKDIFLRDFINGCNVVGVSCTENARTLTENGFDDFDVVIIDEVSKATPPELLIPMLRGRKIVLVGDHRQLPPLFNEHEKSYEEIAKQQEDQEDKIVPLTMADFEKYKDMVTASLFERHFETADNSIKETLTVQYRMHSDIMDLINLFYDGYLVDGNEDEYTEETKAHYLSLYSTFGTEMIVPERHAYWFDSSQLAGERVYEQRRAGSSSCENLVEAETIIELLRKIETQYANMDRIKEPVNIGVISFYYDQVSLIRRLIKQESFHAIDVEVNTVDRFQGKEKEIIFVSLVRNVKNPKHNLDSYIAAFQRINVAFSRAQNLLVILGAIDMYAEQPVRITGMNDGEEKEPFYPYKQILEMMNTRGTYFTCDEVIPEERVDEILTSIAKQGDLD